MLFFTFIQVSRFQGYTPRAFEIMLTVAVDSNLLHGMIVTTKDCWRMCRDGFVFPCFCDFLIVFVTFRCTTRSVVTVAPEVTPEQRQQQQLGLERMGELDWVIWLCVIK